MGPDAVALRAQLEKLLAEHGASVRRVARAYAAAPAEAADLAQEIAIALWHALPSFRGECSERTRSPVAEHVKKVSYRLGSYRIAQASLGAMVILIVAFSI